MRRLFTGIAAIALGAALVAPASAAVTITAGAPEGSSADAFNGATVDSSSALLNGFSATAAFGATFSTNDYPPETTDGTHAIFASDSGLKFINFTPLAATPIRAFTAYLSSDGVGTAFRGVSSLALLGFNGTGYDTIESTLLDPAAGPQTVTFTFGSANFSSYRVEFSDVNGGARIIELDAAVPEPATWAMMIGGFGLMGGALRRRRAVSLVTA